MQLIRSDFREIRSWEFSLQRTVQCSLARTTKRFPRSKQSRKTSCKY